MSIYEYDEERQRKFDREEGIEIGEERLTELALRLMKDNRESDVLEIVKDKEYRKKLYKEYGI